MEQWQAILAIWGVVMVTIGVLGLIGLVYWLTE